MKDSISSTEKYKVLWNICHRIFRSVLDTDSCNRCPLNCVVPCRSLSSFKSKGLNFYHIADNMIIEYYSKIGCSSFYDGEYDYDFFKNYDKVNWAIWYLSQLSTIR